MNTTQKYGPAAISAAGTLDLVAIIPCVGAQRVGITVTVGGTGPLTGIELTGASVPGGKHVPLLTNDDFTIPARASGVTPTNVPSGTSFFFKTDPAGELAELAFRASSAAGATVSLEVNQTDVP